MTGQTMHYLDEGTDTGDIIATKSIPIEPADTGHTVGVKLEDLGVQLFQEVFPSVLAGTAPRYKQDDSEATVCRSPRPRDMRIDWTRSSAQIAHFVRAFTHPVAGAHTRLGGLTVRVWKARPTDTASAGTPGDVMGVSAAGPVVRCGQGQLVLTDFEIEGCPTEPPPWPCSAAGHHSPEATPDKRGAPVSEPARPDRSVQAMAYRPRAASRYTTTGSRSPVSWRRSCVGK